MTRFWVWVWSWPTRAFCWLTGRSNFALARICVAGTTISIMAGMALDAEGPAQLAVSGLLSATLTLCALLRWRRLADWEARSVNADGTIWRCNVDPVDAFFEWLSLALIPWNAAGGLVSAVWWGVDFIAHNVTPSTGVTALDRAADKIRSWIPQRTWGVAPA